MKFIIRDDDLNYFSTPADIERWYHDIFAQNIPVGFSAIPFVKPTSDVYTSNAPKEQREYPLGLNQELVRYVQENHSIEILQHGTTHENKHAHTKQGEKVLYEYAGEVPRSEAKRGRDELERAFGVPVTLFVPPHDWIGTSGVLSVEAAGMDIIRGRGAGLRNWIPRWEYFTIFLRMLWHKLSHIGMAKVPAYPYVLNFGKHKELCSYRLEDSDLFTGLEYAHKKNGIFVVVTHLHYFDEEKKALLEKCIARAQELGAEFVLPSTLFMA